MSWEMSIEYDMNIFLRELQFCLFVVIKLEKHKCEKNQSSY